MPFSDVAIVYVGVAVDSLNYNIVVSCLPFQAREPSLSRYFESGWMAVIHIREPFTIICYSVRLTMRISPVVLFWVNRIPILIPTNERHFASGTPIIASISERFRSRREIMIAGQFCLLASQLLLMEAPTFWVMCLGRLFEGISSAVVMTAGLSLM